jgi:hypothetical protein
MSDPAAPTQAAGRKDWLVVETPEPGYADAVVADISRLAATISGRYLLDDLRASGYGLVVEKPARSDPPNAYARPHDPEAATTGRGSDTTIGYDPRDWPSPIHRGSPPSDLMLFTLLREALPYLWGIAEPALFAAAEMSGAEVADVEMYRRERGGE